MSTVTRIQSGSCSFTNNDTCEYMTGLGWSIHEGEFDFHRTLITNGSGKCLLSAFKLHNEDSQKVSM